MPNPTFFNLVTGLIVLVFARPFGRFGHRFFPKPAFNFVSEKSLAGFFQVAGLVVTILSFHALFLKAPTPEFVSWIRKNEALLVENRDAGRMSGPFFHDRDYAMLREEVLPAVKEQCPPVTSAWVGLQEGERPVIVIRTLCHWVVPESIAAKNFFSFEVLFRQDGYAVIKDIRD